MAVPQIPTKWTERIPENIVAMIKPLASLKREIRSSSRSWSGMEFLVNVAQAIGGYVGVHFGRADVGVAEQFLNDPEVRAVFQQMGGEAVPQHVGSHVASNARPAHTLFDPQPKRHWGK